MSKCKAWAKCTLPHNRVEVWDDVVPYPWVVTKDTAILQPFIDAGVKSKSALRHIADPFPQHISQAFAEVATGKFIFVFPRVKFWGISGIGTVRGVDGSIRL